MCKSFKTNNIILTQAKSNYYDRIGAKTNTSNYYKILVDRTEEEYEGNACIGVGIRENFGHAVELQPMNSK